MFLCFLYFYSFLFLLVLLSVCTLARLCLHPIASLSACIGSGLPYRTLHVFPSGAGDRCRAGEPLQAMKPFTDHGICGRSAGGGNSSCVFLITGDVLVEDAGEGQKDSPESEDDADERAHEHLSQGVLSQQHAAAAHDAGQQYGHTEPVHRIEHEEQREGEQSADESAHGCRMSAHLPPDVHHGAGYLYEQCRNDDAAHVAGHVQFVEHIQAGEIRQDGQDVGHHTMLPAAQMHGLPAFHAAVGKDEQLWQQDGQAVDQRQHAQLVAEGQHVQIGEHEERQEADERHVKGPEQRGKEPCYENYLFIAHFLNLATGIPSCSRYLATVRRAMGNPF